MRSASRISSPKRAIPGNRQRLARVELRLPDLELPPHVALIDTPGLGSVYGSGSDHTLEFLPQLDVALVVLSVDQPLTEAEERLAARLRDQGTELLFAVNKTDHLSPAEIDETLRFVADRLVHVGFSRPPVFGVSAKAASRETPRAESVSCANGFRRWWRRAMKAFMRRSRCDGRGLCSTSLRLPTRCGRRSPCVTSLSSTL